MIPPKRGRLERSARTNGHADCGTIAACNYFGPSLCFDVRMASGDLIVAEGAHLLATDLSVGDDVRVGWDPNDLWLLGLGLVDHNSESVETTVDVAA